jgi:hypothetical protein
LCGEEPIQQWGSKGNSFGKSDLKTDDLSTTGFVVFGWSHNAVCIAGHFKTLSTCAEQAFRALDLLLLLAGFIKCATAPTTETEHPQLLEECCPRAP